MNLNDDLLDDRENQSTDESLEETPEGSSSLNSRQPTLFDDSFFPATTEPTAASSKKSSKSTGKKSTKSLRKTSPKDLSPNQDHPEQESLLFVEPSPANESDKIVESIPTAEPSQANEPDKIAESIPTAEPSPANESDKIAESIPTSEASQANEPDKIAESIPTVEPSPANEPDKIVESIPTAEPSPANEPDKIVESIPTAEPSQANESDKIVESIPTAEPSQANESDKIVESIPTAEASQASDSDKTVEPSPTTTETPNAQIFRPGVSPSNDSSEPEKQQIAPTYQVVARRYRPQGFDQLVGQEHIATALSNAIKTGRVGHAYLFTGARGVGKTSSARIFAKALNCVQGPTPTPCNRCDICVGVGTGEDVDVLEIDGASNRGVDEIRQLRMNASIRPSRARFKIYIIDEVHMLTREAFNALLKTLEEPPEHVKFIFCTTEPTKIPITILSRCQRFDFAGIDSASIATRLNQIATLEGATADVGVCETLARRANGSMRDAQSLLEQLLSFAPKHIRLADVHGMLGTVDDQKIFDLVAAMNQSRPDLIFAILNQAADEGVDFAVLLEQTTGFFRDLMAVASCCGAESLIYVSPERIDELKTIADSFGISRVLASLQILDQTQQRMRYSTQGRILAELAMIRLCRLDELQFVGRLVEALRSGKLSSLSLDVEDEKKNANPGEPLKSSAVPTNAASDDRVRPPKENSSNFDAEKRLVQDAPRDSQVSARPSDDVSPPEIGSVDLNGITDVSAADLWKATFQRSDHSVLSMNAEAFSKIHFEQPNQFIVYFPAKQKLTIQYCSQEFATLLALFQKNFSSPVQLKIAIDESYQEPEPPTRSFRPQNESRNKWQIIRETESNPMIAKAIEFFNAELIDVKIPRTP